MPQANTFTRHNSLCCRFLFHQFKSKSKRGEEIVFSHFELYEENGVNIRTQFPKLFKHMYGSRKRFDMSSKLPEDVYSEVKQILDSIIDSPKSKSFSAVTIDSLDNEILFKPKICIGCFNGKEVEVTFQEC